MANRSNVYIVGIHIIFMSEEAKRQLRDLLANIDFEKGVYKIKGTELPIRDLSITEMEQLQDKEAEMKDMEGHLDNFTAQEVLKKGRDWQNFILKIGFGDKKQIDKIKKSLSALEYQKLVEEVFVFLGRFTGPKGAKEYMTT